MRIAAVLAALALLPGVALAARPASSGDQGDAIDPATGRKVINHLPGAHPTRRPPHRKLGRAGPQHKVDPHTGRILAVDGKPVHPFKGRPPGAIRARPGPAPTK